MRLRIKDIDKRLCDECRVMDYGMCPNLIALHDNGFIDPPVKRCLWKDFYDKSFDSMKENAIHSAKWGKRKI